MITAAIVEPMHIYLCNWAHVWTHICTDPTLPYYIHRERMSTKSSLKASGDCSCCISYQIVGFVFFNCSVEHAFFKPLKITHSFSPSRFLSCIRLIGATVLSVVPPTIRVCPCNTILYVPSQWRCMATN